MSSTHNTGQTQIRRVRLPRIADPRGIVSYEELVGLVIVFTFPENASGPSNYHVSLTYYDVDGKFLFILLMLYRNLPRKNNNN
jgi:hypothetical protein